MDVLPPALLEDIAATTGIHLDPAARPVGGGCIHTALRVTDSAQAYFLKLNHAGAQNMFVAEAAGLEAIACTHTLRVPRPLGQGATPTHAWLLMEWLALSPSAAASDRDLGAGLAALHGCRATRFGFEADNFIGSNPQHNAWRDSWSAFWIDNRMRPQLTLAREGGAARLCAEAEALLEEAADLLGHAPQPSLLHGDLWSGNRATIAAGEPAVFDPAAYYGDHEADLAMTELFGGFGADFYAAYRAHHAVSDGYEVRRDFYNLYHVLNHYNLFGGGYAAQAAALIARLRRAL